MSTSDPGDLRDPNEVRFDPEMRRADRLFQIVQLPRRSKRPMTAEAIAGELEISKRSVYRDIASLLSQRVPIRARGCLDRRSSLSSPSRANAAYRHTTWKPAEPGAT